VTVRFAGPVNRTNSESLSITRARYMRVVEGSRSRFTENRLVLSQFTGNKIDLSCFTKKKIFFDTNLRNL